MLSLTGAPAALPTAVWVTWMPRALTGSGSFSASLPDAMRAVKVTLAWPTWAACTRRSLWARPSAATRRAAPVGSSAAPPSGFRPLRLAVARPATGTTRVLLTMPDSVAVSPRTRKGGRLSRAITSLVVMVLAVLWPKRAGPLTSAPWARAVATQVVRLSGNLNSTSAWPCASVSRLGNHRMVSRKSWRGVTVSALAALSARPSLAWAKAGAFWAGLGAWATLPACEK